MKRFAISLLLILASSAAILNVMGAKARNAPGQRSGPAVNGQVSSVNVVYADWQDEQRKRTVPVKIYFPDKTATGPSPVVIFSHGLGGSREGARYLGEYWSSHGYISIHVQHVGSDSSLWQPYVAQGRAKIMESARAGISFTSFINRVGDIKFVLNEIERLNAAPGSLKGAFDVNRIAICGHSFGAGTSLTLAGQRYRVGQNDTALNDSRIKAAIYLSPPVMLKGRTAAQVYGGITLPGLLMTGTEDTSPITQQTAEERRIPYDGISAPHQYLVTFIGGDHMIFNGATRRAEKPGDKQMLSEIQRTTTAFLNAYLRNDAREQKWLDTDAKAFLASDAKFERK